MAEFWVAAINGRHFRYPNLFINSHIPSHLDQPILPQELRSYNLKSPVGDAAWLPIAPTVFAAVTENGWIHVTDLAQNPWQPLCVQKVFVAGDV